MNDSVLARSVGVALTAMSLGCSASVAPLAPSDAGVCNEIPVTGMLIHGTCATGSQRRGATP